jgi:hypothetical protein
MRQRRLNAGPMLLALIVAVPAQAVSTSDLQHCRSIADDSARLGCYDALLPAAAAPPMTPIKPAPPVAPVAAAPAAKTDADFGAETMRSKPGDKPQEPALHASIVGYVETARKGARYKLDNGQTWQNIDDREVLLDIDHPAVTIERNFIGSYFLQIDSRSTRIRVRRVE